ncbi:hypothetical protein ONR75_18365 [Rhodopseudomonas sp. P2A-2r]|uniref:hypothetical protein n=1 Tax=Rhodopseudomonas sp. P2A-2r TaxID=2991972 RepID=UPI0022340392|nr:hypothetical protein [Rhodopseudomonas sp. P2A-2r]UZE46973.1 hypothetical protein ONR75_18365 [Rhodopseudomonas sp. P2A-2r]
MSLNHQAHEFGPAEWLRDAPAATADIFTDILATTRRGNPMIRALEVARIKHLITCCAWTDAALALLALELPPWQLRRLAYDDGEWHCALSKYREMPDWLDVAVETHHADMALAIVGAVLQAQQESLGPALPEVAMGPKAPDASWEPVLCDNFA